MQTPAVESPPPEELPAELPSPELPEDLTLPEPPVEIEASGLGTDDLGELIQPTAAAEELEEEEDVSLEGIALEDGLITEDVAGDTDTVEVGEEPDAAEVTLEEDHPTLVSVNEADIPEELDISISSETTEEEAEEEEEGLPAEVPPPEDVDVASEELEPETDLLPDGEDSVEDTVEESNFTDAPPSDEEENSEDGVSNVVFAYPEPSEPEDLVFEDGGVEEAPEGEEQEDVETPEAPVVETEEPELSIISTEDLTEDEILLVNKDEDEPPVTDSLSPAKPTELSPERESPFTRISDVDPASDEHPDIIIPTLVEVEVKHQDDTNPDKFIWICKSREKSQTHVHNRSQTNKIT